jgi:hypothetical protein
VSDPVAGDAFPPDESVRERVFTGVVSQGDGRRSLVGVVLAVASFVMVLSISGWQATSEATALPLLRSAVASLTDIDAFIADNGDGLREAAAGQEGALEIRGYPLPIALEAAEVRDASDAELRQMLLDRSAALVYAEGLDVFDRTGEQAIDRFSMAGLLELAVGQLSHSTHRWTGLLAGATAVAVAGLGALLAGMSAGWGRMRAPAAAIALGGVGAAALGLAVWAIAGQVGGTDAFMVELRAIVQAAVSAGVRNGAIVTAGGLLVVVGSWALELVERRMAGGRLEEGEEVPERGWPGGRAGALDEERDAG